MNNASIVDVLIENIKTDQALYEQTEVEQTKVREKKAAIKERLKGYRKDISVLLKYADDDKRAELEELGFTFSDSERGLNPVASIAMDAVMKAKDNKLTNEELFDAYIKTFKNPEDAFNYTEFNIKCRSLFNTQRLLRTKSKSGSSREDIISLNGRANPVKKSESKAS